MTREEAIARIENHKILHKMNEPRAIYISEALDMAIKALEREACEDCISRQAVEEMIKAEMPERGMWEIEGDKEKETVCEVCVDLMQKLSELPPVTPQPKTGHWIQTNEFFINQDGQFIYKFICSECKSLSYFRKSNRKAIGANVCPNCGAMMREVEE